VDKIKKLVDEHGRALEAARALRTEVQAQDEGPTAEQRQQLSELVERCADLHTRIEEMRALDESISRGDKAAAMWARAASGLSEAKVDLKPAEPDLRQMGLAVFEGNAGSFSANLARVRNERELIGRGVGAGDIVGAAHHGRYLSPDGEGDVVARVIDTGSTSTGDHLIPTLFERSLYDFMEFLSGVRRLQPTIMTTRSGAQIEYPVVLTHDKSTGVTAENAEVAETLDTFGQVDLYAFAFTGAAIISKELLQDQEVGLERHIARMIARTLVRKTETMYISGSGTAQPKGIFNAPPAAQSVTAAKPTAVLWTELNKMLYDLDPGYISMGDMCKWTMGPRTYSYLLTLVNTQGTPYFQPDLVNGAQMRLLGRPVVFNAYTSDTDPPTKSTFPVAIGCWEDAYIVRDVGSVEITSSRHARFRNRQMVFQGDQRTDGRVLDPRAVRYLKMPAS